MTGLYIGIAALYCPPGSGKGFTAINVVRPDPVLLSIGHLHQLIKKCTIGIKWSLDLDFLKGTPPSEVGGSNYIYVSRKKKLLRML